MTTYIKRVKSIPPRTAGRKAGYGRASKIITRISQNPGEWHIVANGTRPKINSLSIMLRQKGAEVATRKVGSTVNCYARVH